LNSSQYCHDYDFEVQRHEVFNELKDSFKYDAMLPGKSSCMLRFAEKPMHPQCGPLAFVTPSGTYTRLHLDGDVSEWITLSIRFVGNFALT
jgi:hypothetical protein